MHRVICKNAGWAWLSIIMASMSAGTDLSVFERGMTIGASFLGAKLSKVVSHLEAEASAMDNSGYSKWKNTFQIST